MFIDDEGEPKRCERRDDLQSDRRVSLPKPVFDKIAELIQCDDVRSVSCPYDDHEVWRALVAEQVRRAKHSGLGPQEAFTLCGPDGGLWDTPIEAWGGCVHIPYEGTCGGDLFVLPAYRRFSAENSEKTGRLSSALGGLCCHYLLTPRDFGELSCATRSSVGDWVLYQSKAPYAPCDPLDRKRARERNKPA